ncbi:L,D-transpeptidase [Paenibacillus ihuae]|uniref:L,D-transpeptidase n=1 Tax=Paenibacillus ihuae TaxID=1232431 RepID=UPI001FD7E00B|nr:L,D-transpeptidase [Paenibacillus ihuae]
MAWYLLGKEYYKNGQQGKANYCFNQAGEVYEAFEHSKVPSDMLREYEDGLLKVAHERHQSKLRKRRTLVALVLLLLLFLPPAVSPEADSGITLESLLDDGKDVPAQLAADAQETVTEEEQSDQPPKLAFTALAGDAGAASQAFAGIVQSKSPVMTAILGMERSGKWLVWKKKLPLTATVVKNENGRTVYQSYDQARCECQPPESGELQKQAARWQEQQEQLAVLWSAMRAYKSSKGNLPQSLKELTGAFPDNWLGTATPLMKEKFASLRASAADFLSKQQAGRADGEVNNEAQAGAGTGGGAGAAGETAQEMPFFTGALSIIVDKQNHRLAVTSGSVILRNYAVGLGGDKTPEGTFTITDKVVNPNGRDNGEFGSRGMQLSDSNYAIHGTSEPESIGKDESLGCIRMSRKDVEELFALVPRGTKVQISKGVLPEELLVPEGRFPSGAPRNQTNPNKVYHWLN